MHNNKMPENFVKESFDHTKKIRLPPGFNIMQLNYYYSKLLKCFLGAGNQTNIFATLDVHL